MEFTFRHKCTHESVGGIGRCIAMISSCKTAQKLSKRHVAQYFEIRWFEMMVKADVFEGAFKGTFAGGKMKFPVVVHKDADSDYSVTVPDVPGCFSAGTSFSEALDNVREALALHLEGLVDDEEALPQAQGVDAHLDNPDFTGGVWVVIDFDLTPYLGKLVRFNASLPEHLLSRIDERVQKDHRYASRSGFLATAALRELAV